MFVRLTFVTLCVASGLLPVQPSASTPSDPPPRGYVAYRAMTPVKIDGALDDAAWAAVPWSDEFVDIEGDKKPKPRHRTRMKMIWDDEALYVAAEIVEPHVWATITKHDAVIFMDPDFEVFLDPDGDNHLYGELELNAKNTTWDLLLTKPYKDGGKAVNGWEIIGLETAVKVNGTINDPSDTDTGWTVEVKWPFSGLKEISAVSFPPNDGDQWRVGFSRVEWDIDIVNGQYVKVKGKPEYNWVWSPQGVIDMHRPERWGSVQFSTAKSGTATFKPDPDRTVKDDLNRLYYAQRAYREKNKSYAKSLADLGLTLPGVTLESVAGRYAATLGRYTITEDAHLTRRATP